MDMKQEKKELRACKARLRSIKATVNAYLRAGKGIEDLELEVELEDLSRQERLEIKFLYNKPMKGSDDDDFS